MSRIVITGSSDGLGLWAAQELIAGGHEVVLHARNESRGRDALRAAPGAQGVVIGDLASIAAIRELARQANATGPYDAVMHNAGVGYRGPRRVETVDGLSHVFAVNVLGPYLLTALIEPPRRLVYLSSGMHRIGNPDLEDLQWLERPWNGPQAYADSKLLDVVLAFAVARHWPAVLSNAVEPGWVATRWVARTPRMTCRRGPPPRSGWPPAETRERRSPAGTSTTLDRRQPTRPPLIASSKTNSSSAAPHSAPPAYRHRRPTGAPPRASRSGYGAPGAE